MDRNSLVAGVPILTTGTLNPVTATTEPGIAQPVNGGDVPGLLACVILAHTDAVHVRRLIDALDPFPVFLHVDSRTSNSVFDAMTADLPARCTVLPRISTGWAKWENVEAEINGYRAALASTNASHVALLTGSDYPLATTDEITALLGRNRGRSMIQIHRLPHAGWGRSGGLARLRYRHWAFRKHMIRLPIPRRLPDDVVLAGGSQLKILARDHASRIVEVVQEHPELVKFWRRSWVADETFVPSVLSTPQFVPGWSEQHEPTSPWWIGWDGSRRKSPPWLRFEHAEALLTRRTLDRPDVVRLFARKFSTADSSAVIDMIDSELRSPARTR